MKKQNIRTLVLIVCTVLYLFLGAAVFDFCESMNEAQEKEDLFDQQAEIMLKYNMTGLDFNLLRTSIIKSKPYKAGVQWKFAGSFYFALSVITTIGYGHIAPRTIGGKIFCVIYALLGIPLNIVMFQSIGERFNMGITFLLHRLKQLFRLQATEVTHCELTFVGCVLCLCVLVGGAAAFCHLEDWEFLTAFYYCFITMSTIGFGDYVALQNETGQHLQTRPEYVVFTIVYILFGLTVFAAALNLMVLNMLTMNTEDERKDELHAIAEGKEAPKINGDVIQPNGHLQVFSGIEEQVHSRLPLRRVKPTPKDRSSRKKSRYRARRSPSDISHLLSFQCTGDMILPITESSYRQQYNSTILGETINEMETSFDFPKSTVSNHARNGARRHTMPLFGADSDAAKRYSC